MNMTKKEKVEMETAALIAEHNSIQKPTEALVPGMQDESVLRRILNEAAFSTVDLNSTFFYWIGSARRAGCRLTDAQAEELRAAGYEVFVRSK